MSFKLIKLIAALLVAVAGYGFAPPALQPADAASIRSASSSVALDAAAPLRR